jgi:hypothetical protein
MKEYISSNRNKIIFQLKWTSIILTLIWTVYILVQYNKGVTIDLKTILLGFIIATILLPLFVEFMVAFQDFIAFNRYNKIINAEPFNQLTKLGFTKTYTDKKTNWSTSMPTLIGNVESYPVRVEVENGIVRVIADVDLDQVEKEHMSELKQFFGDKNVEYDWLGVALIYKPKSRKDLTIQSLESDLRQFIKFFKTKKLDHWDINGNA